MSQLTIQHVDKLPVNRIGLPPSIQQYGTPIQTAWHDFFSGKLPNKNTRAAYTHAIIRFLDWTEENGLDLTHIMPGDIGDYFREHSGNTSTKKQHLSALRKFANEVSRRFYGTN